MTHDIERVFQTEALKKSRKRWRIFGVLALLIGLLAVIENFASRDPKLSQNHIARINISGLITGDEDTLQLVRDVAKAELAKALIVRIDSPGGTTSGSEALFEELRKVAKDKPVVAVMDTVAASGGYITALAADHIVARGNTITGSIGVIFSYPEVSKLLDTVGIKMEELKSGELKAEPSPYRPASEKAKAVSREMIQDSFQWFLGLVSDRRKIDMARALTLSDGRVYTGRQALKEKLIDQIGGESDGVAWLNTEKKIEKDLEIFTYAKPIPYEPSLLNLLKMESLLDGLGFDTFKKINQRAKLDGMLVLWHPDF